MIVKLLQGTSINVLTKIQFVSVSLVRSAAASTFLSVLVFSASAIIVPQNLQAETRYVSDELKVPVRSGASNQHRIIKFLKSGVAVTIVNTDSDAGYSQIKLSDGKEGWILSSELMSVPSGKARLVTANKRLESTRSENKELKAKLKNIESELKTARGNNKELQSERTRLSNSIEDLKVTAANPLALSRKNRQLEQELDSANARINELETENEKLQNNLMQEWFIIGAVVSIGSLLLGILLTRIRWKKRDSWGDSF